MSLAYKAMTFARKAHANQKRKYTNVPYFDHLAEVAGIAMSVGWAFSAIHSDEVGAVAWLHDCVEDQGITEEDLIGSFGGLVAGGVMLLSDLEEGNRATRKRLSRERLAAAPGWVQTIKCADLISNTGSIVQFDPDFAKVYLEEKRLLLGVLTKADRRLWTIANEIAEGSRP
ncbi:MAG: guanosine polyphosphate pyrophosphohydrolase [Pusillimonas sp.]|nr:guanosine polyphosphate pyrophosphohydrolase [Pusillimonas sp.]MBC43612.1 guanosine polyphosphate pyrophosphohydrolase [Pusillimonas sp.]|tara:strand:+ start:225 stop:740 length:516 start_codon:yes stop_codon:yes gene_type:complete